MQKSIYFLLILLSLYACRSTKNKTTKRIVKSTKDTSKPMLPDIKNTLNKEFEYDYLSFRANCDYKDENADQSFTMNLRMKKDSIIWISVTAVGFEVARARFDKDSVKIINRLEKKYYIYDYNFVKRMLGTTLSISQIQNLLTANMLFSPENFISANIENKYRTNQGYIENLMTINDKHKITEQILKHLVEKTEATVLYSNYKKADKQQFPGETEINVTTAARNIKLLLRSSNISTDSISAFPFEIQSKYEKGNK